MPERKKHTDLSRILLGESGSDIHKFLDAPVKRLGRNHRSERHASRTVALLYAAKGAEAAEHALGHIILDESTSSTNKAKKLVDADMKKTLKQIKKIGGLKNVRK